MSDWNKFVSFSSSKQANAILFLLVCVILVIVLFKSGSNYTGIKHGGGFLEKSYFFLMACAIIYFLYVAIVKAY